MAYTLRASVRGTNELARLTAVLHRRNVRLTYAAYREDAHDSAGSAVFVVPDEANAERARRALENVVTVTRVRVEAPATAPARGSRRQARHAHPVRDAFARVYR